MDGIFIVFVVFSTVCWVNGVDQGTLDYIGSNLGVRYDVINNLNGNDQNFEAEITLTNNGGKPIVQEPWEIYLYSLYMIEPQHLPNINGYELPSSGLKVYHVNGILFKLQPTSNFKEISENGETLTFKLTINYWSVARSDVMPSWYVVADTGNPVLIKSTVDPESFVGNFDSKEQYKRYEADAYHPFSPQERYERYSNYDATMTPSPILPTPVQFKIDESKQVKINGWKLKCMNFEKECLYMKDYFKLKDPNNPSERDDVVTIVAGEVEVDESLIKSDSYQLEVSNNFVTITAPTSSGAFYAIQSLIALTSSPNQFIPHANITDAPRYEYRGMHLDVARNFVSKDVVIKLLKAMAMYKLNNFHFHLTDDEGWRMEIDSYPELTSVGSNRGHDPNETSSIIPQLGSGPTTDTSGSGYYTKGEYQEILQVAEDNHIRVIPEIDLPGHAHAAIKSNLVHYNKLISNGMSPMDAAEELITDLDDKSEYLSVQMFTDNAVNPCINGTYEFVKRVVYDIINLHRGIQNLTVIHLGGDEIAEAWTNSPKCEQLFQQQGWPAKVADLLEYFEQRAISSALNASENNLKIGLWEDGAMDHGEVPYDKQNLTDAEVIAYAWQNIWEWGEVAQRPYKLANAGYKVVMSQATHLYFDQPNEPDAEERGLYWASRFTDSIKTFSFMPDDIYANSDFTRAGIPFPESKLCPETESCVKLEKPENIIGMQGHLFGETLREPEHVYYMAFPRMLALAERAWHKAEWETTKDSTKRGDDWARFAATLGNRELSRLDELDILYRVPLPGVSLKGNTATINCEFPGLKVRYSYKEDKENWREISCGDEIVIEAKKEVEFQTKSASGTPRYSRSVLVTSSSNKLQSKLVATSLCLIIGWILSFHSVS